MLLDFETNFLSSTVAFWSIAFLLKFKYYKFVQFFIVFTKSIKFYIPFKSDKLKYSNVNGLFIIAMSSASIRGLLSSTPSISSLFIWLPLPISDYIKITEAREYNLQLFSLASFSFRKGIVKARGKDCCFVNTWPDRSRLFCSRMNLLNISNGGTDKFEQRVL